VPASHRSRLHQLNVSHEVRKTPYRGIRRGRGAVPKWAANIRDNRLGRMGIPFTWAPTPALRRPPWPMTSPLSPWAGNLTTSRSSTIATRSLRGRCGSRYGPLRYAWETLPRLGLGSGDVARS